MMLKKTLLMSVGSIIFLVGIILFPLPVPFGLPMMIVGLMMILKASYRVKRTVIRLLDNNQHTHKTWQKVRACRRHKKTTDFIAAVFAMGALVGFSRVVLGVHFSTDTLAGMALGVGVAVYSLHQIIL